MGDGSWGEDGWLLVKRFAKVLARVRLSHSLFSISSRSEYSALFSRFPRSSSKMVVVVPLNRSRIVSACAVVVAILLCCVHDSHQQIGACQKE